MPDLKISELPAANSLSDTDIAPLVQTQGSLATRRATLSQLRGAVLRERGVHIRDFGAVGDGVADDGPALQAAINALSPNGGVVHLGARTYRIGTAVTVSGHAVRIEGQGFTEGGNPGNGTWLTCANPAIFPLTFSGATARGSVVRNLAVREAHGASQDTSWQPTAYQWFFRVLDCLGGVDFEDLLLSGVNRGFLVRNSGRAAFRRIRGQIFSTGIEMDKVYDVARITGVHFWPFWSANDNVVRWQQFNGDAMVFRRVDGVFVDQSFVLGYRSMFRFSSSAAGFTQKFSICQAYADFVRHGLWVEASGTDGQVDSLSVQCERFNANGATLPGSVGILLGAHSSRVQIGQLRVDDCEDNAIRVDGHSNRLDIGSLRVVHFNQRNSGAAACHLAHAATGVPNRVILATAPLLEGTTNAGPLVNGGTNGTVGGQMAAGAAAAPGIAAGTPDTGLFQPGTGGLAASAAGQR
ncbi:glycosyl hydrolase family 28-related protein [Sabulicella rubraurantiaca]|uniref:glycosyl hydrolase family 28-related protein n=1 Tax=Sabulicella rubraurantiaca TaxID=2811429 RepID=UPI001A96EB53|nr:glycosyl hydrolase family 28-related protein [Sabulicella rubraurantiaca]